MMYPELYDYLLQHRKLSLPGIGSIILERKPAQADFPNKQIHPPVYSFSLQSNAPVPGGHFFSWIGNSLGVSQMDAVIRFNNFVFELKKQLEKDDIIQWNGVGEIRKGLAGEIKFLPQEPLMAGLPVRAEKVLRDTAEHTVWVGEQERSSAEMTRILSAPEEKKSYWWAYALVAGLLAVIFTGWYLSKTGTDVQSTANTVKLVPSITTESYKELP